MNVYEKCVFVQVYCLVYLIFLLIQIQSWFSPEPRVTTSNIHNIETSKHKYIVDNHTVYLKAYYGFAVYTNIIGVE